MTIIKNLSDIESSNFTLGEKFRIEKENRISYWDIRKNTDYPDSYDLTRYTPMATWEGEYCWQERACGGSFTIMGCAKMAYVLA